MTFEQLYSGSDGNLYVVTNDNGKRLLIECGVTWKKIQRALCYDLSGIVGCVVSHEHKDHCKAIREVMRAGIDVYVSEGTFGALGLINERRAKVLEQLKGVWIEPAFKIFPFSIIHDAQEPFGFILQVDGEYLLYATDTAYIKQRFTMPFSIIAIECSYDITVLQRMIDEEKINEEVAKRLLTSHMEKKQTIRYLREFCDLSKCREIHLLHMSSDNIDREKVKKEIEDTFFIETRVVRDDSKNQRV